MSFPRPLTPDADAPELTAWLTEWSLLYPCGYDTALSRITFPPTNSFDITAICEIVRWKSGPRYADHRVGKVCAFDVANPGAVARHTQAALTAPTDTEALNALRAIPVVRGPAFGSAVLMAGNPSRWTVFDRMANASLVYLRDRLTMRRNDDELFDLQRALLAFRPTQTKVGYEADARDWVAYLDCCRAISRATWLSLRTVDRALYEARAN